ncbi:MAG: tRNA (adenosine(37)-N6)-threonylcarbamoyltransferase complex ATPase subunit type 1 TsaE [Candidatus Saccharimonadales bacterium]
MAITADTISITNMRDTLQLIIESKNPDDTLHLAKNIGTKLTGGEVIELISDLGGGKTTFVKGLAIGLGSKSIVKSPSFTIQNEYTDGRLPIYHFDFYRLNDAGLLKNELVELFTYQKAVIVIEWSNNIQDLLPINMITINIKVINENSREIIFSYPNELCYLLPSQS